MDMLYECKDLGSGLCPCRLMESGDCYVCTLERSGRCLCGTEGRGSGWGGSCPYAVFVQNGCKAAAGCGEAVCATEQVKVYSEHLTVLRLGTEAGFAQRCGDFGAFVMAETLGYSAPLSVLRAEVGGAKAAHVDLAVQPAGPKTKDILRRCGAGEGLRLKGPLSGGISGAKKLFAVLKAGSLGSSCGYSCSDSCSDSRGENAERAKGLLVIAKGIAAAPYVNGRAALRRACAEGGWGEPVLWLDKSKLSDEFIDDYILQAPQPAFTPVSLDGGMEALAAEASRFGAVLFLASPYHTARFKAAMKAWGGGTVIASANHAAMCCGEGICGSCSYADADGVTVKLCKCLAD